MAFLPLRFLIGVVICCAVSLQIHAHDAGLSTARVALTPNALEVTVTYAPADVARLFPSDQPLPAILDAAHYSELRPKLMELAPTLLELRSEGTPLRLLDEQVGIEPGNNVEFRLNYLHPPVGTLEIRSPRLKDLPLGHRELFTVVSESGALVKRKLLTKADPAFEVGVSARSFVRSSDLQASPSFFGFFKLGVEHIPTGYDHLLFLLGLLLVCESWRSIVGTISSFTIAHSLTLALATLNLVQVPSRWIDPCIAASIVYVGVENLYLQRGLQKRRWILTFAFGLVHGFGFATVLRELGVGENDGGIVMPLFAFNCGVEVGQILISALILPLFWHLRKNPRFKKKGIPALSAMIVVVGLYWLLERTLFYFMSTQT